MKIFNQSLISDKLNGFITKSKNLLIKNKNVIILILIIAIFNYGFELFNINLTIDEEIAAARTDIDIGRISNGRWGLYFLNKILVPFSVIPFVPLFLTILFQLGSILLLFESLNIKQDFVKVIIGGLFVSWPGMAYMYSFSTGNYGVGFGLLCVSLSLFLFSKNSGVAKLWSVVPSIFVFSIYEPLLPALIAVFVLYILVNWDYLGEKIILESGKIVIVLLISFILYYSISNLLLLILSIPRADYISHYFNFYELLNNSTWILRKIFRLMLHVFSGDKSIYGLEIRSLGFLIILLGFGILNFIFTIKRKFFSKIIWLFLLSVFVLLPFIGGLLTKGYIPKRSLISVPIIIAGLSILGLRRPKNVYFYLVSLFSILSIFQFISSSNHLFASSYFALEEDKTLATLLINRIELEKANNDSNANYLELIGFVERPSTPLVSRIENIGASFFGWDGGHPLRAVSFLKVLGYNSLEALPLERRIDYIQFASGMTVWPEPGSVRVVDDVVLVKFSPYSNQQIKTLCSAPNAASLPISFCPQP